MFFIQCHEGDKLMMSGWCI